MRTFERLLIVGGAAVIVVLAVLTAITIAEGRLFGTPSGELTTFDCARGFRSADWREQPLKTGQTIASCRWLHGKRRSEVKRRLGRPMYGTTSGSLVYALAPSRGGIGPLTWELSIRLDRFNRVADATTATRAD